MVVVTKETKKPGLNLPRHQQSLRQIYEHLAEGRTDEARPIQHFYDEYLAVNDLPAEFYLETVEKVFQTHDLARGRLVWGARTVDLAAIRRTALMTRAPSLHPRRQT